MHLANAYFGHTAVLADYAGLSRERPIWGMLQHGWNPGTGFTPDDPPRALRRSVRAFVWNRDNLHAARAAGYRNVHPIGAPFTYLGKGDERTREQRTLAYPFHGWEREAVEPFHATYADQICEREGANATVCLFWTEYRDPTLRSTYESRGLRVISHGYREGDPRFLIRQHEEIVAHHRVVTNRVATALWYGGWLERELEVYGPEVGTADQETVRRIYEEHRQRWPELFDGPLDPLRAHQLGARELGTEFRRSPRELRDVLGWSGGRSIVGPLIAIGTRAGMRAKRRWEGW